MRRYGPWAGCRVLRRAAADRAGGGAGAVTCWGRPPWAWRCVRWACGPAWSARHNQAAFTAHAVRTRAIIARIYYGAPSQNYDAPTFDQYAIVNFEARGRTAHARVLLASDCRGTCLPGYRVGQALSVEYSPENLTYAQLPSRSRGISVDLWYVIVGIELLGVMLLVAAVINMVTA